MRFSKHTLKVWLRSGSWNFMKNSELRPWIGEFPVRAYSWRGKRIFYRAHSSDAVNLYKILLNRGKKGEYALPKELNPEVILDIGANTGIASIYFATRYPKARILAFEPVPENFALLKRNAEGYGKIEVFPYALGKEDSLILMDLPAGRHNLGSFSFFGGKSPGNRALEVEKRDVKSFLAKMGVLKVNLIKIDTEGAEHEILTSMDRNLLSTVDWIVGELHGIKDFEALEYLSEFFHIQVKKTLKKKHFMFQAGNRKIIDKIRG